MPETGVFPFFIKDRGCATGWTLGTGMALHPRIVLVMVSKSVTPDILEWHSKHTGHVMALSIGTAFDMRYVVVPHGLLLGEGEEGTVRYIRESIERNREFMRHVFEMRRVVSEMWQKAGFSLHERQVGDPAEAMWNEDTLKLRPPKEQHQSAREISR